MTHTRMHSIPLFEQFEQMFPFLHIVDAVVSDQIHLYRLDHIIIDRTKPYLFLPPNRKTYYNIDLFVKLGGSNAIHYCNNQQRAIQESSLQFIHPNHVESVRAEWEEIERMQGFTLYFKPDIFSSSIANTAFHQEFDFFDIANGHVLSLTEAQLLEVSYIFERIYYEYHTGLPINLPLIRSYLLVILYKAKQWFAEQKGAESPTSDRSTQLAKAFEQLAYEPSSQHKTVQQLAEQMAVSSQHLSETVKEVTGRTAKEVLIEAQVLEAKTLLLQTNLTVSQVAYELGYNEPSQFMHFFKRHIGLSPQQYRRGI